MTSAVLALPPSVRSLSSGDWRWRDADRNIHDPEKLVALHVPDEIDREIGVGRRKQPGCRLRLAGDEFAADPPKPASRVGVWQPIGGCRPVIRQPFPRPTMI